MRKLTRLGPNHKNKTYALMITLKSYFRIGFIIVLIGTLFCGITSAQEKSEWPNFHGLSRDNKSSETGLLKKWPENGPKLLWTVEGLGRGYSCVSIAEGYLFTSGVVDKQTVVFAFDLNGKLVWKKSNGESWEATASHARAYNGARSTPTYDNGILYHLSDMGRLAAFNYKTGEEIWFIKLREAFDAEIPEYGYSESVLIDGEHLYCNPAGKKGFMVCLNKKDGKLIWANTEIPGNVGFSSPIIAEFNGTRQIINLSSNCIYGAGMTTGKMLWSVEYENSRSNNCTDAIFQNGHVLASSGYGKGSISIKLTASGKEIIPETVWQTELMDNHHGGVILHDGYLYGAGHNARGWFCLDFMTGKELWKAPGKGSLTYADNMFYFLEERGIMRLVNATPEKYEEVSSFRVPEGGDGVYWSHPVVFGGHLFLRHHDKLFAYEIKSK